MNRYVGCRGFPALRDCSQQHACMCVIARALWMMSAASMVHVDDVCRINGALRVNDAHICCLNTEHLHGCTCMGSASVPSE